MVDKGIFISTAIDYPNAPPHIGHLYEKVCADVIARWNRLKGEKVHFSTGTDEYGSKIEKYAKDAGKTPKKFVDEMSVHFIKLCEVYNIKCDDFIRTTEGRHAKVVNELFMKLYNTGDIYKGKYEGFYCVDCETFLLEKDLISGKCPVHKKPAEWLEEESYFFKMSKYKERLIKHIKNDANFITPKHKAKEILKRLEEPLKDLIISRKNVKWCVALPIDKTHTDYIWTMALDNYLTTIDYPNKKYETFWPGIHLIGVDIVWHHTVIWGSLLMALGLKLPKVVVHGFITVNGEKMSKSLGNVLDPIELALEYGVDQIRYYLMREIPFGEDGDFSIKRLKDRVNGELVKELGNLVSRSLKLTEKVKGKIEGKAELKIDIKQINKYMDKFELHHALDEVFIFIKHVNKYINDTEPWKLDGKELNNAVYNLCESLRIIAILLHSFIPSTSDKILNQLGVKLGGFNDCTFKKFEGKPKLGNHLFELIQ